MFNFNGAFHRKLFLALSLTILTCTQYVLGEAIVYCTYAKTNGAPECGAICPTDTTLQATVKNIAANNIGASMYYLFSIVYSCCLPCCLPSPQHIKFRFVLLILTFLKAFCFWTKLGKQLQILPYQSQQHKAATLTPRSPLSIPLKWTLVRLCKLWSSKYTPLLYPLCSILTTTLFFSLNWQLYYLIFFSSCSDKSKGGATPSCLGDSACAAWNCPTVVGQCSGGTRSVTTVCLNSSPFYFFQIKINNNNSVISCFI